MADALRRGLLEASQRRDAVPANWVWPSAAAVNLPRLLAGVARELLAAAACVVVFLVVRAAVLNPLSGAALWFVLVVGCLLGFAAARRSPEPRTPAGPVDFPGTGPAGCCPACDHPRHSPWPCAGKSCFCGRRRRGAPWRANVSTLR